MNAPATPLPEKMLPLFCVSGVILLPRMRVPLNIFESLDIEMISHALGHNRLIGIVQPIDDKEIIKHPALYKIGCIGKIVTFAETENGHFLISLLGISRFIIKNEESPPDSFRRAEIDKVPFQSDTREPEKTEFERERLILLLKNYFSIHSIGTDWSVIQNSSDEDLVSSLCLSCPFEPSEKQALLESPTFLARTQTLIALLEMACMRLDNNERACH